MFPIYDFYIKFILDSLQYLHLQPLEGTFPCEG
jgi:hypothetical protein